MNQLCGFAILKTDCPGVDSPILNYSAELPDELFFFSAITNPGNPGRLGQMFTSPNCAGVAFSADSQADADLLARQSGAICNGNGNRLPAPGSTITSGDGAPVPVPLQATGPQIDQNAPPIYDLVSNRPQTAQGGCSSLQVYTYTVPAGKFTKPVVSVQDYAAAQVAVDAEALAYAQQIVSRFRYCILPILATENLRMCLNQPYASSPSPTFTLPRNQTSAQWAAQGLPPGIQLQVGKTTSITDINGDEWLKMSNSAWMNLSSGVTQSTQPVGTSYSDVGTADLVGTPTATGDYNYTVTATGLSSTASFSGTIKVMGFTNTSPLPSSDECTVYNLSLGATGGDPPYSFSVDPTTSLPDGLTIVGGILLHGLAAIGSYSFKLIVSDKGNNQCSQQFSYTVTPAPAIAITTGSPLPNAHTGSTTQYNVGLARSGGCAFTLGADDPDKWVLDTGSLPDGLTIVHDGSGNSFIRGYPNTGTEATYNFTLRVTDWKGHTTTKAMQLTVDANYVVTGACTDNSSNTASGSAAPYTLYPHPPNRATANFEKTEANAILDLFNNLTSQGCDCPPGQPTIDPTGAHTTITNNGACTIHVYCPNSAGIGWGDVTSPISILPGASWDMYNAHFAATGSPPIGTFTFQIGGGVGFTITY
jgi:hypothetical protein